MGAGDGTCGWGMQHSARNKTMCATRRNHEEPCRMAQPPAGMVARAQNVQKAEEQPRFGASTWRGDAIKPKSGASGEPLVVRHAQQEYMAKRRPTIPAAQVTASCRLQPKCLGWINSFEGRGDHGLTMVQQRPPHLVAATHGARALPVLVLLHFQPAFTLHAVRIHSSWLPFCRTLVAEIQGKGRRWWQLSWEKIDSMRRQLSGERAAVGQQVPS